MADFELNARDGVDPKDIPQRKLLNGMKVPAIGLSTYAGDAHTAQEVAEAVLTALCCGYRFIDCAAAFGNEAEIGVSLEKALNGGLKREDLFISSRLRNSDHAPDRVRPALEKTLASLRLDYLDLYTIHWPVPNVPDFAASPDGRSPNAKPYDPEAYLATYRELEKALDDGLIRATGTANMSISKLKKLLPDVQHMPVVNQMEMHPGFAQNDFFTYLREQNMWPIAFCPLGSTDRPDRPASDTAPGDLSVMQLPAIVQAAAKHGVTPAAICLKWAVQRGQIPIPSATKRQDLVDNLHAITTDPLAPEEMVSLAALPPAPRLIKGVEFLWPEAMNWEELWNDKLTINN